MKGFLDLLKQLNVNKEGINGTESDSTECISKIDHQDFHLWLLIPSSIMILALAFTISRKNKYLTCFHGRPGAVFPMDILGRSHRFSYAAAWGAIAYLAADMVISQEFAVELQGKSYFTAANGILSMLIYGVDYFPLFAALAMNSVAGHLVGTSYAWMLFVINVFKEAECDFTYKSRIVIFLRDLPNLLCLGYLAVGLPFRTFRDFRSKKLKLLSSAEMVSILDMTKSIKTSTDAVHVRQLLQPSPAPIPTSESFLENVKGAIKEFATSWIYHSKPNFRYSSRITSVMLIGVILIYKFTLELMVIVISLLRLLENAFIELLDSIGHVSKEGEAEDITDLRDSTIFMYDTLTAGRVCFVVSLLLACVMGLLSIVHMLSSYRTNLFNLYKGDNTHIPHRSTMSNASLMVGSMKFAGYQVGYIGWGLVIQFLILFIVSSAVAIVVTLIQNGWYQWIIDFLLNFWPVMFVTIVVMIIQLMVAKFVFLQENGDILAINNRRVLFSFTFFMFFYNIFIGFISCLLRITKSIVIGAIFLPRLDNSALPRRFQMFDPGFSAYVGFLHVECAHTHPVMIVFLRILMLECRQRHSKMDHEQDSATMIANQKTTNIPLVSIRARTRWFLMYTLYNNPAMRAYRKSYLASMKEMQERFAKTYNLNKTAMGKLVKEMNKSLSTIGMINGNISSGMIGKQDGGLNQEQINWNALLNVQKFFMKLQKNSMNRERTEQADAGLEMVVIGSQDLNSSENESDCDVINQDDGQANAQIKLTSGLWKKAAQMTTTSTHGEVKELKL